MIRSPEIVNREEELREQGSSGQCAILNFTSKRGGIQKCKVAFIQKQL